PAGHAGRPRATGGTLQADAGADSRWRLPRPDAAAAGRAVGREGECRQRSDCRDTITQQSVESATRPGTETQPGAQRGRPAAAAAVPGGRDIPTLRLRRAETAGRFAAGGDPG